MEDFKDIMKILSDMIEKEKEELSWQTSFDLLNCYIKTLEDVSKESFFVDNRITSIKVVTITFLNLVEQGVVTKIWSDKAKLVNLFQRLLEVLDND